MGKAITDPDGSDLPMNTIIITIIVIKIVIIITIIVITIIVIVMVIIIIIAASRTLTMQTRLGGILDRFSAALRKCTFNSKCPRINN